MEKRNTNLFPVTHKSLLKNFKGTNIFILSAVSQADKKKILVDFVLETAPPNHSQIGLGIGG